jgi:hypothetical protein
MQEIKEMSAKLTALLQGFDVGFDVLRSSKELRRRERRRLWATWAYMIKAVDKIWSELGLSKTPKHHAMSQLKWVGDYACMLEDDKWHSKGDGKDKSKAQSY